MWRLSSPRQGARLAKFKTNLQLFQEHFYLCTIIHIIYFWPQNIKCLNTWCSNGIEKHQYLCLSSYSFPETFGLGTCIPRNPPALAVTLWESLPGIIIWGWEGSTETCSNKYSTYSWKRERDKIFFLSDI
jgi:hypothetical protein